MAWQLYETHVSMDGSGNAAGLTAAPVNGKSPRRKATRCDAEPMPGPNTVILVPDNPEPRLRRYGREIPAFGMPNGAATRQVAKHQSVGGQIPTYLY
jgi:hypothetical protein